MDNIETIKKFSNTRFTDILLIFDFDCHSPNYDPIGLVNMQRYFDDSSDAGKLYINYPMAEAINDIVSMPDYEYIEKKTSCVINNGLRYKTLVGGRSYITKNFTIKSKLRSSFGNMNLKHSYDFDVFIDKIVDVYSDNKESIKEVVQNFFYEDDVNQVYNYLLSKEELFSYTKRFKNYARFKRYIYNQITIHIDVTIVENIIYYNVLFLYS